MLISIQDDLIEVKEYLMNKGYNVENISTNIPSDTYIYSQPKTDLLSFKNSTGTEGSLIINTEGMSLADIEYALKHRTYTPLF